MVRIKIVATGDVKDKNIKAITDEFYKRLSRWAKVEEVIIGEIPPKNDAEIPLAKRKQAEIQLAKLSGFVIALDRSGKEIDSVAFAKKFDEITSGGVSMITFVIGGSNGFDKAVLDRADFVLSFGKMTYPHELMRAMLVEQIYRAFTINNNIAYHK